MKSFSLFIVLFVICSLLQTQSAKSTTSCTAIAGYNVVGVGCSISCGPTQRAYCKATFFTETCVCVGINDPDPALVNPSPTSGQYSDAVSFASFLHSSPSSDLQNMEASVNDVISGASNSNWSLYFSASDSFYTQFSNLSSTDKGAINTWRYNHGYTIPL